MSMTIDQIREERARLERDVFAVLGEFERRTGLRTRSVFPNHVTWWNIEDERPRHVLEGVRVNLDLGLE